LEENVVFPRLCFGFSPASLAALPGKRRTTTPDDKAQDDTVAEE
jgi:hypothetical protein